MAQTQLDIYEKMVQGLRDMASDGADLGDDYSRGRFETLIESIDAVAVPAIEAVDSKRTKLNAEAADLLYRATMFIEGKVMKMENSRGDDITEDFNGLQTQMVDLVTRMDELEDEDDQ